MERFEEPSNSESKGGCPLGVYENLLASLPAWVFGVDEECKVVWSNSFSERLTGFNPIELQSKENGLLELLGPDANRVLRKKISTSFTSKNKNRFFAFDTELIRKDQSRVYVNLEAFLLLEQEGHPSILFFMAADKTDKVLMKRTAENEERLVTLGTMASEIAHEIKNSLVSIGALVHLLKKRSEKEQRRGLELVENEIERLERLARSVNTLARPAGSSNATHNILSLLQKSLCLLSPEIRKRNVKISLELSEHTQGLKVSSDMLMVAFINLIRNAISALPPKGKLWIKSKVGEEGLHLEFRNEMVKKRVSRQKDLFRPLAKGGTSIGLPFSYKIVQNMGGSLAFRKDGNLAIFSIFLPNSVISAPG